MTSNEFQLRDNDLNDRINSLKLKLSLLRSEVARFCFLLSEPEQNLMKGRQASSRRVLEEERLSDPFWKSRGSDKSDFLKSSSALESDEIDMYFE